jgi:hypothetical protein
LDDRGEIEDRQGDHGLTMAPRARGASPYHDNAI